MEPSGIGRMVKDRRVELGLTQVGAAKAWGMVPSLIGAMEIGQRRYVTKEELDKLAKALGLSGTQLRQMLPNQELPWEFLRYVRIA